MLTVAESNASNNIVKFAAALKKMFDSYDQKKSFIVKLFDSTPDFFKPVRVMHQELINKEIYKNIPKDKYDSKPHIECINCYLNRFIDSIMLSKENLIFSPFSCSDVHAARLVNEFIDEVRKGLFNNLGGMFGGFERQVIHYNSNPFQPYQIEQLENNYYIISSANKIIDSNVSLSVNIAACDLSQALGLIIPILAENYTLIPVARVLNIKGTEKKMKELENKHQEITSKELAELKSLQEQYHTAQISIYLTNEKFKSSYIVDCLKLARSICEVLKDHQISPSYVLPTEYTLDNAYLSVKSKFVNKYSWQELYKEVESRLKQKNYEFTNKIDLTNEPHLQKLDVDVQVEKRLKKNVNKLTEQFETDLNNILEKVRLEKKSSEWEWLYKEVKSQLEKKNYKFRDIEEKENDLKLQKLGVYEEIKIRLMKSVEEFSNDFETDLDSILNKIIERIKKSIPIGDTYVDPDEFQISQMIDCLKANLSSQNNIKTFSIK